MSDEDDFLSRWSRRKQAARIEPEVETPSAEAEGAEAASAAGEVDVTGDPVPLDLPPIESLDASSDYTAFLQPSVPAELRLAALRRAWASDAGIAGFRGMAEYDWDFNAPGYGKFLAVDNVAQLVDAVFGPTPEEKAEREARLEARLEEERLAQVTGDEKPSTPSEEPGSSIGAEADTPTPEAPSPRQRGEGRGEGFMAAASEEDADEAVATPEDIDPPPRRRHGGATPS